MGIHYDYKSTRGEKAMKKEAKRKARLEQRRARKSSQSSEKSEDKNKDLGEELADVLFVLLCIANQTGINLQSSFDLKLKIKAKRDHKRHKNNPKLKL